MQITDEVVSLAIDAARKHAREVMGVACEIEPETMRAALEAALGARKYDHALFEKVRERLSNNGRNAANNNAGIRVGSDLHLCEQLLACIEDLAAALRPFASGSADGFSGADRDHARATLERWGLK